MRRQRKEHIIETYGMSFMDCLCCGFGAIILMFVLTKFSKLRYARQPQSALAELRSIPDQIASGDDAELQKLEHQLLELHGQRRQLDDTTASGRHNLAILLAEIESGRKDLATLQDKMIETATDNDVQNRIGDRLMTARQQMTDEMKRLLKSLPRPVNKIIGGIPADSEYIVFIIDTSGSMQRFWPLVRRKIEETLEIYPQVKGMQIMNDMGQYMFSQYKGQWIPDTPGRRKLILEMFNTWRPFSNSSPVEGIETAIRKFYAQDHKISLYVFGDDFQGFDMSSVITTVDHLNRKDDRGGRRVRIHAVGFPGEQGTITGKRFSTLMRVLCDRNAGTFVGLATP